MTANKDFTNQLILGDNLEQLKNIENECVDLIYLDPPFFSNRNYEVIWGDDGEVRSFQDRWAGGIEHYIDWLKERVKQMYRILKPTGSIFLHCDWHANAYIRVNILDDIFGKDNYNSEIILERTFGTGSSKSGAKKIPVNVDSIFFYNKSKNDYTFNVQMRSLNEGAVKRYDKIDDDGRRFFWADMRTYSQDRLNELLEKGEAIISQNAKNPRYKKYLDESKGTPFDTLWNDIAFIGTKSKERIGYPTQKPEALLQRIIEMASNEGDIVLDPFVGGGTTVVVADKLKRKWIGIDQSVAAIRVSDLRLKNQQDLYSQPYDLQLRTYNAIELRNMNPFEFETFIIKEFGGIPNPKQRNDFGLDGAMPDNTPLQVKRSDNIGRNVIDNFKSAAERYDKKLFDKNIENGKPVGYLIAYSFNKGAFEEVARLKNQQKIIIELKKVSEIVPMENPPEVLLTADEIERNKYAFNATAKSEAGVEFFSWDFNHKPEDGFKTEIYLDKDGKQVRKLQPGEHHVAVEAVDKHGLDGMDTIKLNVKE